MKARLTTSTASRIEMDCRTSDRVSSLHLLKPYALPTHRRHSCEERFRDAKWYLGFKQARVKDIRAWSRLFALFVLALLILVTLGTFVCSGAIKDQKNSCGASLRDGAGAVS